jgi:hypothetical protein
MATRNRNFKEDDASPLKTSHAFGSQSAIIVGPYLKRDIFHPKLQQGNRLGSAWLSWALLRPGRPWYSLAGVGLRANLACEC